jgi:hypothetical protein
MSRIFLNSGTLIVIVKKSVTNYFPMPCLCGLSLSVLQCFQQRGKLNVVADVWTCYQISANYFEKLNNSDQISPLLMMLIVNINVLPYFENRNKVYELHSFFGGNWLKVEKVIEVRTFTVLSQPLFLNKCLRLQT